ncbi:DUF3135 domain-containing protein [Marinobacter salsuginis]|uniref:DUF3135 domain-containing protein n=1 Tax=Marinobacter salsuginis TaxID=418719 RepID=A0A5M3PU76_9GAMM|nr:DUF3135 domain-containing protein [Marinobacter salsuginis]GBO86259.1 hypothetical protein MS5N3_37100 [Marinobacter salsuginis]
MDKPTFDELIALYTNDPEAFEHLRHALIEMEISDAPPQFQRRLRGLQFQVECAKETSKTPLASCIKLQSMMLASAKELRGVVQYHYGPDTQPHKQKSLTVAESATETNNIIEFIKRTPNS